MHRLIFMQKTRTKKSYASVPLAETYRDSTMRFFTTNFCQQTAPPGTLIMSKNHLAENFFWCSYLSFYFLAIVGYNGGGFHLLRDTTEEVFVHCGIQ